MRFAEDRRWAYADKMGERTPSTCTTCVISLHVGESLPSVLGPQRCHENDATGITQTACRESFQPEKSASFMDACRSSSRDNNQEPSFSRRQRKAWELCNDCRCRCRSRRKALFAGPYARPHFGRAIAYIEDSLPSAVLQDMCTRLQRMLFMLLTMKTSQILCPRQQARRSKLRSLRLTRIDANHQLHLPKARSSLISI